jgi:hypothetical protein
MAHRIALGAILSALALSLLLAVSGCDFDSAYEAQANGTTSLNPDAIVTARVVGSVGDGPIVDGRVRVYTNSGQFLTETRSSSTADYEITVKTQGRNYPLTIVADDGIDLVTGGPPDFSLVSVIMGPGNREIANLNPYSTLIVRAAEKSGGISDATIAAATEAVVQRYGFGLDSSLVAGPIFTPIDDSNVHVIVKASETLGEMIRRTRDAVDAATPRPSGRPGVHGDDVVEALAADLVDGWIDGRGATGRNPRVAAVANVASAAVMVEAMANRLHVYGNDATAAMDQAIWLVRPNHTAKSQDVGISPEALAQSMRALHAAMQVTSDDRVREALYAVRTTPPGSTQVNALPSGVHDALNLAILDTAYISAASQLDDINRIANSEEVPYLEDPSEPAPPDGDANYVSDPIVNAPEEEEEGTILEEEPIYYKPNAAPVISGTPTTALVVGQPWSFTPDAYDPDGDTLTFSIEGQPDWAEFDPKTGRIWWTPHEAGSYGPITINVSDHMDSASLETFTLQVDGPTLGTATVSWEPPTLRTDGSALTDLAGYRVYYGKDENSLTHVISISGTGLTSQLVENLEPGTWYFAVTAYDSKGLESPKSEIGSKKI